MAVAPFFLDAHGGRRFCLHHAAQAPRPKGLVLYVPPFAEELNKARRMAALQSRACAAAGFEVLQLDLLGCGDSSGDFENASWQAWVDDVVHAASWLRARDDRAELWLWGLRAGCLLAADAAERLSSPCHFLFWQPVLHGKLVLQQFLRLRQASEMAASGGKGLINTLRAELSAGHSVEVAGYVLSSALADGLARATLRMPATPRRVVWLELDSSSQPQLLPASSQLIASWRQAGHEILDKVVAGPPFWATTEIEEAVQLIDATAARMAPASIPVPAR